MILLDREGRVLLIRFVLPRRDGDYLFWATPGGEREGDEAPLDTARREVREELGLVLPLEGPVHHASGTFEFLHETVDNEDDFYVARWPGGPIALDGVDEAERTALKELRWWSAEAIDASAQPVYPPDLADVVRRLGRAGSASAD
ncbi:NUDIX hydrolase [Sphingomonas abietis]|uniref:NUDIX domain-containing protein n=1 Tax=Sphingomonas abietis TaxID=3012344 RepID=A0ABY7NRT1_9SPHN|nr:NUDIX domain-containing protein [Sphingomonas abietis]WBO24251.1 NUDIX domain-containing protein [Sphingomonas abietis]